MTFFSLGTGLFITSVKLDEDKSNYHLLPKNASGYVFDLCFSDSRPVYMASFSLGTVQEFTSKEQPVKSF